VRFDRKHDIPYLAGYSLDGKTIYIDRHMPASFKFKGRTINTDRFLVLHEEVEKTLIDQLGLHYLHAHQIATRAEEAAVRAAGLEWRDYDRFMQKFVKRIGDERLSKIPRDLDTKPYRDEHDDDLLRRMLACVDKGEVPKGFRRQFESFLGDVFALAGEEPDAVREGVRSPSPRARRSSGCGSPRSA
jgi:hypothetical protein